MDERLDVLDLEVAMINSRIRNAEEEIRLGKAAIAMASAAAGSPNNQTAPGSPPSFVPSVSEGDLGWENGTVCDRGEIFSK
jgi:hypothetical protein